MEDAPGTLANSNDDQGPLEQNDTVKKSSPISGGIGTMRFPWSPAAAPPTPTSPCSTPSPKSSSPKPSLGHKRSVSGSILAKLNFLRTSGEDGRPPSRERPSSRDKEKSAQSFKFPDLEECESAIVSPVSPEEGNGGALGEALQQGKSRKRKGSLRKTALLGGRRFTNESKDKKNSPLQRTASPQQPQQPVSQASTPLTIVPVSLASDPDISSIPTAHCEDHTGEFARQQLGYETTRGANSSESHRSSEVPAVTTARLALITDHERVQKPRGDETEPTLSSPLDLKSPVSQTSYTSTTDEEEPLTIAHPTTTAPPPVSSTASSYFPSSTSALSIPTRHHSTATRKSALKRKSSHSPLAATSPLAYSPEPEPHDYTETAYWGYVILASTWIVFTVGMGSCLGVWSWAWDVGETPYAPPELEDDATLPIVGYYPALIVLSGVVAWIWITVAWLGMKYFRHARIEG
ncbi:hypothetical protein MBLNU230_g3372t1 [Neophaeotheca triangularis]